MFFCGAAKPCVRGQAGEAGGMPPNTARMQSKMDGLMEQFTLLPDPSSQAKMHVAQKPAEIDEILKTAPFSLHHA